MEANKWLIFGIIVITLFYKAVHMSRKQCIQVVTIVLMCFSGFRSYQMGDLFHYYYAYLVCNTPGWTLDLGKTGDTIGLQLFFHGAGSIGISFQGCLFIISAFVAITLGILIYRYSPSPFWSYIMYVGMGFYISTFNILKQAIAMGFIVLAMICVLKSKPTKFVVLVTLAMLFHLPAGIFLVAYPFARKKIDVVYFIILALTAVIVFLFRNQIVEQASILYYEGDIKFESSGSIGGRALMMSAILALGVFMRPLKQYDMVYSRIFNILVLATIVQTFSVYDNVFSRLADYFFQFVVLLFPLIFQPGREQAKQFPGYIREIRYFTKKSYQIIKFPVFVFTILYYLSYVEASSALLSGFSFFWNA